MATITVIDTDFETSGANTDKYDIGAFLGSNRQIVPESPTNYQYGLSGGALTILKGAGFTFDSFHNLAGGTITSIEHHGTNGGGDAAAPFLISGLSISAAQYVDWGFNNGADAWRAAIYGGDDVFQGGVRGDLLRGFDGADSMSGAGGDDTLDGGAGNDSISGGAGADSVIGGDGSNYLRGDDGDDVISGGSAFDDINGNMGNDTAHGNAGDDWVVGGKDNDQLFGDAGNDIVWGNLGADTLDGGDGNDQVRGGQGDDVLNGGAGNDFVSGDRGNDTISGGAGADLFHDSQDAGIDRVLDFSLAEGDRVMLDPGTTFTVSQVGADTLIDMGSGNQMILVGVQASTLPAGTIFLG